MPQLFLVFLFPARVQKFSSCSLRLPETEPASRRRVRVRGKRDGMIMGTTQSFFLPQVSLCVPVRSVRSHKAGPCAYGVPMFLGVSILVRPCICFGTSLVSASESHVVLLCCPFHACAPSSPCPLFVDGWDGLAGRWSGSNLSHLGRPQRTGTGWGRAFLSLHPLSNPSTFPFSNRIASDRGFPFGKASQKGVFGPTRKDGACATKRVRGARARGGAHALLVALRWEAGASVDPQNVPCSFPCDVC